MLFACLGIVLVLLLIVRFLMIRKKCYCCLGCPFAKNCEKTENKR